MQIINASSGLVVRNTTQQEDRVYDALDKWRNRLQKWEYSKQISKNKNRKLKVFIPNYFAIEIGETLNQMCNQKITPEEAMSVLHTVDGRTQIRMCMESGF